MKSQIKNLEMNVLTWFIMTSSVLGIAFNAYINVAKHDAWMSPIIGSILGLIPLYVFIQLINYKDQYNINDLFTVAYGKIGKLVSILMMLFVTFTVIINFYNLTNFISSEYLYITPKFFIAIMLGIPIIYALVNEFRAISRSIMIFGFIAFFFFLFGFFGLIFQTNPSNLLPMFEYGSIPSIIGGLYHVCYIVLPLFLLTIIPKENIRNKEKFNKRFFITYLLSSLSVFIIVYVVLSTFGTELSLLYQYPSYNILKRISILTIFDRVESVVAIMWVLFIYVACVIGCLYTQKTVFQLINKEETTKGKYIMSILVIIILYLSFKVFPNNTFVNKLLLNVYPFLLCFFFFIIPTITLILLKCKKKVK